MYIRWETPCLSQLTSSDIKSGGCRKKHRCLTRPSPLRTVRLREDLLIALVDCYPCEEARIAYSLGAQVLRFSYVLSGESISEAGNQRPMQRAPQHVEVRYIHPAVEDPDSSFPLAGQYVLPASQRHIMADIFVRPEFLRIALMSEADSLPEDVRAVMQNEHAGMEPVLLPMTPEQIVSAGQLMRCCFKGASRLMYLKSKVLELLSLFFAQRETRNGPETGLSLSEYDVGQLHHARNMLVRDLEKPPSLANLARAVGLNETKLKRGFKALFDDTVYGYFRSYRLDLALQMLTEDKRSVSEVAMLVGYSNISHFSAAFCRRHGVNPSRCRGIHMMQGHSHDAGAST